jgi:hypothetical protein
LRLTAIIKSSSTINLKKSKYCGVVGYVGRLNALINKKLIRKKHVTNT